jgi:hypothetical protein
METVMQRIVESNDPSVYHGGVWPTETQQLLLRAALLDAPAATEAFARWRDTARLDSLDGASYKLLPLLYGNLTRLGIDDPLLPQMRDCRLRSWSANQQLFFKSAAFLGELRQAAIPALVLKGVALANLYYQDTGARPMADLDLLVPPGKFFELSNRLLREGWKETDGHALADFDINAMPSFGFVRADGFSVDVHCHVLHADCSPGADDPFWARAVPWTLRQTPTSTLAPEDHLLHVISHGVRWCDVAPFRWIADAWWILARSRVGFDWDYFIERARFHEVHLSMLHGLDLMNRITPLDLPAGVLAKLERIPVSVSARVRYLAYTHPLSGSFFPRAAAIWKILGEGETRCAVVGEKAEPATKGRDLFLIPPLLLFALKVAVRERKQIWKACAAWMRGGNG